MHSLFVTIWALLFFCLPNPQGNGFGSTSRICAIRILGLGLQLGRGFPHRKHNVLRTWWHIRAELGWIQYDEYVSYLSCHATPLCQPVIASKSKPFEPWQKGISCYYIPVRLHSCAFSSETTPSGSKANHPDKRLASIHLGSWGQWGLLLTSWLKSSRTDLIIWYDGIQI